MVIQYQEDNCPAVLNFSQVVSVEVGINTLPLRYKGEGEFALVADTHIGRIAIYFGTEGQCKAEFNAIVRALQADRRYYKIGELD